MSKLMYSYPKHSFGIASAIVALSFAPAAVAQTFKPTVFTWDTSDQWLGRLTEAGMPDLPENLTFMVVAQAQQSPEDAAAFVCERIRNRLFAHDLPGQFPKTLTSTNICILVQNFGTLPTGAGPVPCNFFVTDDQLQADPAPWPYVPEIGEEDADPDSRRRERNPWMYEGIDDCRQWMQRFLTAYDTWWNTAANTA